MKPVICIFWVIVTLHAHRFCAQDSPVEKSSRPVFNRFAITTNLVAANKFYNSMSPFAASLLIHCRPWRQIGLFAGIQDRTWVLIERWSLRGSGSLQKESRVRLTGLRMGCKIYGRAREAGEFKGFYFAPYIDVMKGERRWVERESSVDLASARSMKVTSNEVRGRGYYVGGGVALGYCFTIKRLVIEPVVGLGMGKLTGTLPTSPDPNPNINVSYIGNDLLSMSATHAQLHLGWIFD